VTTFNDHELAAKLRIVQWEVLNRDLVAETLQRRSVYTVGTQQKHIQGYVSDSLQSALAKASWVEHLRGIPPYAAEFHDYTALPGDTALEEQISRERQAFASLLPKVLDVNPSAFEDLVRTFIARRETHQLDTILLEDGELSFFSLLWL